MSARLRWIAVGTIVAVVLIVAAGCTREEDRVPEMLLTPAPRECPHSLVRAGDSANPLDIGEGLHGHLPERLPRGFGLMGVWAEGGPQLGSAMWTDRACREIAITVWQFHNLPRAGPRLGDWVVNESGPHDCGNAVLGDGRCLRYYAVLDGRRVEVFMMGVERSDGDPIVLSIRT